MFVIGRLGIEDQYFIEGPMSNPNNSYVGWVLGITDDIDLALPQKNMSFNRGRTQPADIDIDIADRDRGKVKEYIRKRFGSENVAGISTYTEFKDKGVIKDAARCFYVPLGDVEKFLKGMETFEECETSTEGQWFRSKYPEVMLLAKKLRGRIRGSGIHAGGIVIANQPISNFAPIETRKDPSNQVAGRIPVVAYNMNDTEEVGLIKFDFLGLKTLSVLQDAIDLIEKRRGVKIDLTKIPLDDKLVYADLRNGFNKGVFQFETSANGKLAQRVGVNTFDQLVACTALVRPGAMDAFGNEYVSRAKGLQQTPEIHPVYDDITRDTYGKCLYQDQEVLTTSGPKKISMMKPGDTVMGEFGKIGTVTKVWCSGTKEVIEYYIGNGRTISCTPDHKVLTSSGYIEISEAYSKGIPVAINRTAIENNTESENEKEAIVLAGLIADPLSSYIRKVGLGGTNSKTKFIPNEVFLWSEQDRLRFIGYYISCDGHVGRDVVKITTASKDVANGFSDLLYSVGINNKIHYRNDGAFEVFLNDNKKYNEMVRQYVVGKKKYIDSSGGKYLGDSPKTPRQMWLDSGLTQREFTEEYGISRPVLLESYKYSSKLVTYEKRYGIQGHYYHYIVGSKPIGMKKVYDMTVPETNSFICSGVIVHNCLYQEQQMLIANKLAGMNWAEADGLRKKIAKKMSVEELRTYKEPFINGVAEKVDEKFANDLWNELEKSANYVFNKSHSVAYTMISYWTAWLKRKYTTEFIYALLKNEKDKNSLTEYLIEAKRLGVKILMPHINKSDLEFSIEGDSIRFGLSSIKYISDRVGQKIIDARPYNNYQEFLSHAQSKGSGINSRAVGALNAIGGASFPDNPLTGSESEYFYEFLGIPNFHSDELDGMTGISMIEEFNDEDVFIFYAMAKSIKRGSGWSRIDFVDSSGAAGIFHNESSQIESGKMYLVLVANNRIERYIESSQLQEHKNDPLVRFLKAEELKLEDGKKAVISFTSKKTKAGRMMGNVVLSNKEKVLTSAMVFPSQYPMGLSKLIPGKAVSLALARTKDNKALFVEEVK